MSLLTALPKWERDKRNEEEKVGQSMGTGTKYL